MSYLLRVYFLTTLLACLSSSPAVSQIFNYTAPSSQPILSEPLSLNSDSFQFFNSNSVLLAVVHSTNNISVGSTLGSGLFATFDLKNWQQISTKNIKAFAVDIIGNLKSNRIYLAAGNGLHLSSDFGKSWKLLTDWRIKEVLDVKINTQSPNYIYIATAFGFWFSDDFGKTWQNPISPLQNAYCYKIFLENLANKKCKITVSSFNDSLAFESENMVTWNKRTICSRTCLNFDCGLTLPVIYDFTILNNSVYFATQNGVYVTANTASNLCTDLSYNLRNKVIHAICSFNNRIIACVWGNGAFVLNNNEWSNIGLENSEIWRLKVYNFEQ